MLNKEELKYFDNIKRSVKRHIRNNKLLYFVDFNFKIIRFEDSEEGEGFFGVDDRGRSYIGIKNKDIKESYNDYSLCKICGGDSYDLNTCMDEIKRILYHEIGHYIIYQYNIDINIELPLEGKTEYAYKDKEEDFVEAFADYMLGNKFTIERNKAVEDILKKIN